MNTPRSIRLLLASLFALVAAGTLHADWKDDVGYTRLQQTYTTGVPSSVSVGVTQVEANDNSGNNYLPDSTQSVFSGKTIANLGSGSGTSDHATIVGSYFYGNASSLIPSTTLIDAYSASTWAGLLPYGETRRVQNHSWIGTGFADGTDVNSAVSAYNVRVDYMANTAGTIVVAGVNNGYSTTLPYLLCQGYNLISVGLTNGQHSAGLTAYDGTGRIKPDLVAPDSVTSFSTPQVSSAAGLLAEKLVSAPYSLTGANIPRVVKSLLLTGATKDEFTGWSRSETQPIDNRYGTGELNVLLAYRALLAGPVSASGSATVPDTSWASSSLHSNTTANSRTYFFDVPSGTTSSRFAATLVWHRAVTYSAFAGYTPSLANLDLTLFTVNTGTFSIETALQTSASTVDNVEHIYVAELPAGRYALRISSNTSASTPYALSWRTSPTVTVAATTPTARELNGTTGLFTVTRTGPTTSPLLVPLTWTGTAIAGTHYTSPPPSVLISSGSSSTTVTITPVSDNLAQGDRTITLSVATDFSLSAGLAASATVTHQDKPFDAWRFTRFTTEELADPLISGDSADPDTDGTPNLLEYALGTEPKSPDASTHLPAPGIDNSRLTLTYTRPAVTSDLTYTVEWSGDLQTWDTGPAFTETISTTNNEDVTTTVVTRAVAALDGTPRQFLRLRVTR